MKTVSHFLLNKGCSLSPQEVKSEDTNDPESNTWIYLVPQCTSTHSALDITFIFQDDENMFYIAGNSVRALIPSGLTQPFIFLRQIDRVSCTLLCEGFQVRPCKMQFYIFFSGSEDVVSSPPPAGYVCLNILEDVWVSLSLSFSVVSEPNSPRALPHQGVFQDQADRKSMFS